MLKEYIPVKISYEEALKIAASLSMYELEAPIEPIKSTQAKTVVKKPKKKKKSFAIKERSTKKYKEQRLIAIKRDDYKCVKCGNVHNLCVHHVLKLSNGGTNDAKNLITLCELCHAQEHIGENVYNLLKKNIDNRQLFVKELFHA
jgi:5-methylcytosine-specific restriction endonuclease McrA